MARDCGIACVSLRDEGFDASLLQQLHSEVLATYKVIPIHQEGDVITLAMADPLDVVAEDVVRFATGCKVKRVVAPLSEIQAALEGRLGQSETLLEAILRRIPDSGDITYIQSDQSSAAEKQQQESADLEPTAPVIQLVSSIIGDAIRMGASDIHVEPMKASMRVRYRLDGYLRTIVELPKRVQGPCISRLKIISGLDISESRKPQDGRTRAVLEGREVDLRVSSLPTYFGEKVVLRILDPAAVVVALDKLGFDEVDFEHIQQALASSQGMILCTGPTGSGKTSTLYSSLLQLNQESDNVVTVEDPIEYQLEGINQVQVNVRAGVTFASALRSILRQDPDVVLIGEIRDLETAEIAVQAAQTGHLVLSTLHTNDSLSTISRLVVMGVPPYLLASSLLCVLAQRLVRRLCPHCRQQAQAEPAALRLLKAAGIAEPPETLFRPAGCDKCNYVGYRGRMGIFELLMMTSRVRQMLLDGASEADVERLARSEGMHSLLEDGLGKCAQGLTSLDELLRVITIRRVGGRRCPQCDSSVPPEHTVCVFCGCALLLLCPHCKCPMQPEWKVCPQCQKWVKDLPETPAPALVIEAEESPLCLPADRLSRYLSPPLFWRLQALYDEEVARGHGSAVETLGRLCGLAVQYCFSVSAAALFSIGQLEAALEKRLEKGLSLRQKQNSLPFLFRALAQHQTESRVIEQVARLMEAPDGGPLSKWLLGSWGDGETFGEFFVESAHGHSSPLGLEHFVIGMRLWLGQMASWFANHEHYFEPTDGGFLNFMIEVGDDFLVADCKGLDLDTGALGFSPAQLGPLLASIRPDEVKRTCSVSPSTAATTSGAQIHGVSGPNQSWILLVTPAAEMLGKLSVALLEHHFAVLTAQDIATATTLTHQHMPDLVVVDIDTPDLNAPSWIGELRANLESALIPVILLTDTGENGVRGLDSGADSYLLKPVEDSRFLSRVSETLHRRPGVSGAPKLLGSRTLTILHGEAPAIPGMDTATAPPD
ncbi:Flp pilus assembly complex ATPase component TadA [bacterium]|nr:Flp pilus assembly complex ATPase component TadA [bacterium]